MSPNLAKHLDAAVGFPRVSGDEPSVVAKPINFIMFSPRERG